MPKLVKGVKTLGFSLVELVIAIAILSILAALVLPNYTRYQQKAKVSSYALPIARACALDAITHCMSGRLADEETVTMNVTAFPNCRNSTTALGNLTIDITGSITCEPTGHVSNCTVYGKLQNVTLYQARCSLRDQSLHCEVISTSN